MAGNPNLRDRTIATDNTCAWLFGGPYYVPGPFNWGNEFHIGGDCSEAAPPKTKHVPEVTPELLDIVRRALHLWFLLDHPQYDERGDLSLFQEKEVVNYAQQGRDFAKELNVTGNSHKASRKERYAYRSRLKEGTVPRDEKGRCFCQKGEFRMLIKRMRGSIREDDPIEPFRAPGHKPMIRISDEEEGELIDLRDWYRGNGTHAPPNMYSGGPSSWKKKKDKVDPNGYLTTVMQDGRKPGVMLYRCGGNETRKLDTQTCLNAVANRALVGDTVKLLMNSLAEDTQNAYLKGWKVWARFCESRGVSPWANTTIHNWDQNTLCYLTWEHTVVKNGGETLARRLSDIRFCTWSKGEGILTADLFVLGR